MPQKLTKGYLEASVDGDFIRKEFNVNDIEDYSNKGEGISYSQYFDVNIDVVINDLKDKINISLKEVTKPGVYEINGYNSTYISYFIKETGELYHTGYVYGVPIGKVIITEFDIENKIIEGSFEVVLLESQKLQKTTFISKGKFSGTFFNIKF